MVTVALPGADPLSQQAAVTDWPARLLLVVATALVIAGALLLLRRGWRNRARRQSRVLPAVSGSLAVATPVTGKYLGTVPAGQLLERIVAAGGVARCQVGVSDGGVVIARDGAGPLVIPRPAVTSTAVVPGMVQRYYGRHGVLLINWRWDGDEVSSGIWFADPADQTAVVDQVERMRMEEVS